MHLLYVEHFRKMNLRSPVRVYIHIATIEIVDLSESLSRGSERTEYVLNERTLSNTVRTRAKRVFNRFLVQNVFYHRSPRPGTSDWQKIRKNADWIVQLHSADDDVISVAEKLQSEYMELERRGHFVDKDLPDVARGIKEKTFSRQCWNGKRTIDMNRRIHLLSLRKHCDTVVIE